MDQIVESYNVLISLFVEKFKVIRDDEINNLNKTMDGITKGKISFETFLIGVLYNTNDLIVINNIKKVNMRMEHVLYGVCDPPSAFEKLFIAKYEKGIEML